MCIYFQFDSISLPLTVNMAGNNVAIELFGFIKRTHENVGIFRASLDSINPKNCLILVGEAQFFISSVAYLLFETSSIVDYGMVFFTCASINLSITIYLLLFWQTTDILNYIENCERFIEKSK